MSPASISSPAAVGTARGAGSLAGAGPGFSTDAFPTLSRGRAALIVGGILMGLLMGALDNLVVVTTLPQIVTDLHGRSGLAFVVSAYLITSTVATPIFGKLSDQFGRRNFFVLGLVIFVLGSILSGLSQTLNELIAFRAIQGFGSGAFFPVGVAIIGALFKPEARSKLTGAFSSIFGIASIVGPFLGSFIVDHTTWRWVFYVNLPVGIAGIAVILVALGPLKSERKTRFDWTGAGLLSAWVAAFMLALVQNSDSHWAWTDPRILGLLGLAVVLFVAFAYWELRTEEPVVPLRFFKKRIVAASSGVAFLRGAVFISISTIVSIYVAFVLGGSADTIRDVLWGFIGPMIVGSMLGGQLLPRVPYRALTATGMALMALGTGLLVFVSPSTPVWQFSYGFLPTGGLLLDLLPLGFGVGLTFAVTALSVQYAVELKDLGAATSLVQFLSTLGGSIGLSVLESYQSSDLQAIAPAAPAGCGPLGPFLPTCFPYLSALRSATATSFDHTFFIAFLLALGALASALLVEGRLPRSKPADGSAASSMG